MEVSVSVQRGARMPEQRRAGQLVFRQKKDLPSGVFQFGKKKTNGAIPDQSSLIAGDRKLTT